MSQSAEKRKYEELVVRVGNSEPHFCDRCATQTNHILIQEHVVDGGSIVMSNFNFKLKCRTCGNAENIFSYRRAGS